MRRFLIPLRHRWLNRGLSLRPEATVDAVRYPLGFVPLDGSESIDGVYGMLKQGYFVAPLNKIETIHKVSIGARSLCRSEYPVVAAQDVVNLYLREKEVMSRILIRRDFWSLDDFNDPELNQSYGVQNLYFDNYKWSQVLWKRFQIFVEEYYPIADHSHLLYSEYVQLIRSFSAFEQGMFAKPALPKAIKLHPPYGAVVPAKFTIEPIVLLKTWVTNFRAPLALHRALVVNAGAGVVPFALKLCHIPMVRGTDSRPRFITACRKDAARYPKLENVSFQVAELLPSSAEKRGGGPAPQKYDLVCFYPDEDIVSSLWNGENDLYAPSSGGCAGILEEFFEKVTPFLSDNGVIAICCTNIHSLLYPDSPHPIEYEVKHNRRFVVLDYHDAAAQFGGNVRTKFLEPIIECKPELRRKLRSELWILHKIESISHFGFIHGIPGAKPPNLGKWRAKRLGLERQKALRNHVTLMGGDWGDYKGRLVEMLREQTDEPEDDVAEAIRMALDPMYPAELAKRAKAAVESHLRSEQDFHTAVMAEHQNCSPREAFKKKYY